MAQMPPQRIISSIDYLVLSQDIVAVGRVTSARSASKDLTDVTIAIEEVLKGTPPATIERRQDRRWTNQLPPEELFRMAADSARVLVVGARFTPLRDKGLAIPAASGTLLRESNQVIGHIQQVLRSRPPTDAARAFLMPFPKRLASASIPRFFNTSGTAEPKLFQVPVDGQLEAWARETILSRPSKNDLYSPFEALSLFESDANVEFLKSLLDDPAFSVIRPGDNNGIELRLYDLRSYAYKLLQKWNVAIDPPVLREEVPQLETLKKFTWGTGPGYTFDRVTTLSKDLKELTISRSAHPSREQLARIGQIRSLTRLTLDGSDKKDVLRDISGLVNLETLALRSAGITDNSLGPLLSLPRLRTLDIENSRITDAGLRTLARIPTLKTLVVTSNAVTPGGVKAARALRPDLEIRR
jgi:hypothetical protein